MDTIHARNVNDAFVKGITYLRSNYHLRESRNGPVFVAPNPVTTVYRNPTERVLFLEERDANPFFHLVEALWMLAGRNDLATLTPYVSRMKNFSDDGGKTQPGAYGKRWRDWFLHYPNLQERRDQLLWAIERLRKDPNDRRVVIQMYDAEYDQNATDDGGKDIPCNLIVTPWVDATGSLSMSVFCRSNDIIWGAYGANAVHFSFLLEYLALGVGVPVGTLYQISNNYHAYLDTLEKIPVMNASFIGDDPYARAELFPRPLLLGEESLKQFDEDLTFFFEEPSAVGFRTSFLRKVASPMVLAHMAYRKKNDPERFGKALDIVSQGIPSDWRLAGEEWINRRRNSFLRAKDDGVVP